MRGGILNFCAFNRWCPKWRINKVSFRLMMMMMMIPLLKCQDCNSGV